MLKRFLLVSGQIAMLCAAAGTADRNKDPRITSVAPFVATAGSTIRVVIRGTRLDHTRSILVSGQGVTGHAVQAPSPDGVLEAEIAVSDLASAGSRHLRVVTEDGITNELPFHILGEKVQDESSSADLNGPAVISGVLSKPGEVDKFWMNVSANETWTFEAQAGTPGFDAAIAIYERSGSWFDPDRLNRIAVNDEPLHFPGLSSEPRLTYHFAKAGKYAVAVSGFSGQGGPDCVYALRISRGAKPHSPLHPPAKPGWEERQFTRVFPSDWLQQIAGRGGALKKSDQQPETYEAADADAHEIPVVTAPAVVHGRIGKPAQTGAVELKIDSPSEIVLEVETPKATMPRFNPVVRLLDSGGNEMVTNVYTKLNNNGLYMMKMIQAKSTVSLRSPGRYRVEVRDITTDCAGEDFEYRVLIRPQIPHLGKVSVVEQELNLRPGAATELHLNVEREEDFAGTVAFDVEGLPAGVSVSSALPNPVEKPPLPNGGKLERYTPKTQSSVLVMSARPDAAETPEPVPVRVVVRPIIDGHLGSAIAVREVPVFIAPKSAS